MEQEPPARHPVRYFLGQFPGGFHAVERVRDGSERPYAFLIPGELTVYFARSSAAIPPDALISTPTREVTARQAREVRAMRSPLVPRQEYIARLYERWDATLRCAAYYRAAGNSERARMLELRGDRILRRAHRITEHAYRSWFALRGRVPAAPIVTQPEFLRFSEAKQMRAIVSRRATSMVLHDIVGHA